MITFLKLTGQGLPLELMRVVRLRPQSPSRFTRSCFPGNPKGTGSAKYQCISKLWLPVQHPVRASTAEVAVETASVSKAAMALCPLEVVLERVTVTANGNVIACWQIAGGADPSEVRR